MNFSSALADYGADTYLLTVSEAGPHTSYVEVRLQADKLHCWLSRSAAANVEINRNVSLLWPPSEPGGYSIIVNGVVDVQEIDGQPHGVISVSKSVFHRPGLRSEGVEGVCPADCIPLTFAHAG